MRHPLVAVASLAVDLAEVVVALAGEQPVDRVCRRMVGLSASRKSGEAPPPGTCVGPRRAEPGLVAPLARAGEGEARAARVEAQRLACETSSFGVGGAAPLVDRVARGVKTSRSAADRAGAARRRQLALVAASRGRTRYSSPSRGVDGDRVALGADVDDERRLAEPATFRASPPRCVRRYCEPSHAL